jgi:hypothetical protein
MWDIEYELLTITNLEFHLIRELKGCLIFHRRGIKKVYSNRCKYELIFKQSILQMQGVVLNEKE